MENIPDIYYMNSLFKNGKFNIKIWTVALIILSYLASA